MSARSYFRPLTETLFARALTTEESILEHLKFIFQTEKGSFQADPSYGCEVDFLNAPGTFDESRLREFFVSAIRDSEPRVASVDLLRYSRSGDVVAAELAILYRQVEDDRIVNQGIPLSANVDLHDWTVDMKVAT